MPRLLLLAFVLGPVLGCGGSDGPPRFAAHGEVTLGGELVPAGDILFEPDTEKGNSGPGARAQIENGRFSLPAAKGHVGGPHRLRLTLYDGKAEPDAMLVYGNVLLHDYVVERDLPKKSEDLNFSLPPLDEVKEKLAKP